MTVKFQQIKNITILGVGLIGGSLGLALKENGFKGQITGLGRRRETLNIALERNVVDFATTDFKSGVEKADLLIIGTPVSLIPQMVKRISEQAPPKKVKKEKPESVPLPDKEIEKIEKIEEKKQNPEKIDTEVKQVSEFEKKELFDPNNIAALIDKSKEDLAETTEKTNKASFLLILLTLSHSDIEVSHPSSLILAENSDTLSVGVYDSILHNFLKSFTA